MSSSHHARAVESFCSETSRSSDNDLRYEESGSGEQPFIGILCRITTPPLTNNSEDLDWHVHQQRGSELQERPGGRCLRRHATRACVPATRVGLSRLRLAASVQ